MKVEAEKEERVINRSLFLLRYTEHFFVYLSSGLLPLHQLKLFLWLFFFFFFKAIETPSAPTKAAAPVAATRQDVYAGKEKYLARGRII